MNNPSPKDRAALDEYIKHLAKVSDGFGVDEFRWSNIQQARITERLVRLSLYAAGMLFMSALLVELIFYKYYPDDGLLWIGIWAMALGGLGAIASIFLHILKLIPQQSIQRTEEIEVIGRIFLGCLFSLVLALTIVPDALLHFFEYLGGSRKPGSTAGGVKLLLPFLCGYSIPLVLGLLGKAIQAIELTIGLDERRARPIRRRG